MQVLPGMSSRARGISPACRRCNAGRMLRTETRHCRNNPSLTFGIPDKMAVRSAPHLPSRAAIGRAGGFDWRPHVVRLSEKPFAKGPHVRQKRCFLVCQVPSLRRDAGNTLDGTSALYGSAGETTGFLAALLLLCTATSRGKDDHYRGLFAHRSGEIYFWWSEFWTECKRKH